MTDAAVAPPAVVERSDATPLERVIGVRALALTTINITIGAGIFGLPAAVAAELGPSAVLAYVVCGIAILLVALCLAEAGARVPRAGGPYAYVHEAFGPLAGSVAGTVLWLGAGCGASAAVVVLLVRTVSAVVPALADPVWSRVAIVALYAAGAWLNVRDVRGAVRVSEALTVTKLVPLLLVAAAAPFIVTAPLLQAVTWPGVPALAHGSALLFFAFTGIESALCTGAEVVRPERTIPRGVAIGIAGIVALYAMLQLSTQAALGDGLATATTPVASAAGAIYGTWAWRLVLAGSAVAMLGWFPADLLATPRSLFALARDGLLPARLGAVHSVRRTPHVAVLTYAALACALALSGTFRWLAVVAGASSLLLYLMAVLALPVLRWRAARAVPVGGTLLVVGAVAASAYLFAGLARNEWIGLAVLIAVAVVLYAVARVRRR